MAFTYEQEEAIKSVNQNTIVSASAGSGKTTIMMERVSRMLTNRDIEINDCVDISRLLIVTFTNAVATELKAKIAKTIVKDMQNPNNNLQVLKKQLEDLPLANISTIHGMCSKILREYFAKIDLDPAFVLMDEKESAIILNKAVKNTLSKHTISYTKEYEALDAYFKYSFVETLVKLYEYIRINVNTKDYIDNKALFSYTQNGECLLKEQYISSVKRNVEYKLKRCDEFRMQLANVEKLKGYAGQIEDVYEILKNLKTKDSSTWIDAMNAEIKAANKSTLSPEEKKLKENAKGFVKRTEDFFKKIREALTLCSTAAEDKQKYEKYLNSVNKKVEDKLKTCDEYRIKLANIEELKDCAEQTKDVYEILNNLKTKDQSAWIDAMNAERKSTSASNLSTEENELKVRVQAFVKNVKEFFEKIRECLTLCSATDKDKQIANELLVVIADVDEEYKRLKNEENKIDFADLEHKMVELLDDEDTLKEIQSKFDYIFVDEYQDINVVQDEILKRLSSGNNLFMVGDVKQSIYGFRHTDPTIFLDKVEDYTANTDKGKAVLLNKNYRSRKEILEFVNLIFNAIMEKDFSGIDYEKDAQLIFGQTGYKDIDVNPIKIALFDEVEKAQEFKLEEDRIYSVKNHKSGVVSKDGEAEALYIYEQIQKHVGKTYVYADEEVRLCRYSDIALLCRKRSKEVSQIVETLTSLGVPIDSTAIVNSSQNDAIELLISMLEVINNGYQDVNLANVLLSPFGDFSLADLYKISSTIKSSKTYFYQAFNSYKGDAEIEKKIEGFKTLIDKYKHESQFMQVDKLLEKIIAENLFDEYVLSTQNGSKKLFQVRTFLNGLAKKSYNNSLSKFLSLYRDYEDISSTVEASTSDNNCVKTATIHASKGLEYPIVFYIDAATEFKFDYNAQIRKSKNFGIAIKHIDLEERISENTCNTLMLKTVEEEKIITEELRLFYVALTRAREYLYITATSSKLKTDVSINECKSHLDFIVMASKKNEEKFDKYFDSEIEQKTINKDMRKNIILEEEDATLRKMIENNMIDDYAYKSSTQSSIARNVTELNKLSQEAYLDDSSITCSYMFNKNEDAETSPQAGTAYHRVLECIDYNCYTLADVEGEIERMVFDGQLTIEQKALVKAEDILACMESEIMQLARNSISEREKLFSMYIKECEAIDGGSEDKILIKGAIDLFIRKNNEDGENILVDFKYSKSSCDKIKERYRKQLDLYQMALEKCLGEKIDRKIIYVLGANETIEY